MLNVSAHPKQSGILSTIGAAPSLLTVCVIHHDGIHLLPPHTIPSTSLRLLTSLLLGVDDKLFRKYILHAVRGGTRGWTDSDCETQIRC